MKIEANRNWHPACLVRADIFERLWRRNHLYVGKWEGDPERGWFRYKWTRESRGTEKVAFRTADVRIESDEKGHYIYFVNGRHRTRWLLPYRSPHFTSIFASV
jgi:hypothetical protein